MSDFVHLHCHSEYSLLDGLSKIDELLAKTKEYGQKAIALTDHGAMYGVIKFYLKAKEAQIKPIIGCEVYMATRSRHDKQPRIDADQHHLVLLAENEKGYKNLLKLITIGQLEGFYYKPRIDMEALNNHHEGLIALSACLNGEIPHYFRVGEDEKAEEKTRAFQEIFGPGRFYLEIQSHSKIADQEKVNKKMISLAKKTGIPLVATNDCHYVNPEDAFAQEALLCLQTQKTLLDKNRPLSMIDCPDFYYKSPEEMTNMFLETPEAIKNTLRIAEMCDLVIPMDRWILPEFPLPEGETPDEYLKKLVDERLPLRYPEIFPEISERVERELKIIVSKGFSTYFLIVADIVNWAKANGIRVGPGRGSVAGSIVSYILRITSIDPLEHKLPFERFMNPERPSPPDIDLDFADDRREEIIAYATKKYGKEKVAQIITFGTMEARQSVRDVGRVMGMPYSGPDRIAKLIPFGSQGFPMTIRKALETVPELKKAYDEEPETKKLLDLSQKLEGVARHSSTHAAGIVIADRQLTDYTPLQKEVSGERIITQYDMYSLDVNVAGEGKAIGLLKMDFLGLRNLTILEKALGFVRELHKEDIDLSSLPLDDKKVYEMIASGETTGVFQLESPGMRRLARDLKPSCFSDITAMVALFRPGPMSLIPDFIAGKKDARHIKYAHPDLKPILEETYGILVYQEQCLLIPQTMAGFTLGQADGLRRAIGKKKKDLMEKEKQKFLKGAREKGYSEKEAERVFSFIEKFASYGFNKAHSASYAMIAYQTAYMKAHYPVEFMAALLAAETEGASGPAKDAKLALAVEECKRVGVKVLPPDINRSELGFTIEKPKDNIFVIRFGLSAIKNVGEAAITSVLAARNKTPFFSLEDFIAKVDLQKVNKKTLESLIKAGAMDAFGKRAAMLMALDKIMEKGHQEKRRLANGQTNLFGEKEENSDRKLGGEFSLPDVEEFSRQELLAFERNFLGFYLTESPLSSILTIFANKTTHSLGELNAEEHVGASVNIGGLITQVKKILTKKNNSEMAFVKIEDQTGSIEAVVFPRVFEASHLLLIVNQAVLISGRIESRDEKVILIAEKISNLELGEEKPEDRGFDFEITIPANTGMEKLLVINQALKSSPGLKRGLLVFEGVDGRIRELPLSFPVDYNNELKEKIKAVLSQNGN